MLATVHLFTPINYHRSIRLHVHRAGAAKLCFALNRLPKVRYQILPCMVGVSPWIKNVEIHNTHKRVSHSQSHTV
jgi:hypothetical protein